MKDGTGISDFLNIVEAHVSLMNFENFRIVKEMRNSVNRRVNCETANIGKTVSASTRQAEDILLLQQKYGFENLPESLREMAEVRLAYPDAPLRELGEYLDPPVNRSGRKAVKGGVIMKMKAVRIQLNGGLEARPVAMLVQVASQHDSTVYLESEGKKVNAKSIMGMMSLGLDSGEMVTVIADGPDEEVAVEDIAKYLCSGKSN